MSGHIQRRFAPNAPIPPDGDADWPTVLHWILRAVETDHPDLAFACSLLAQAIERPGLTERQARYAGRMYDRLLDEWRASRPAVQALAHLQPAGRA